MVGLPDEPTTGLASVPVRFALDEPSLSGVSLKTGTWRLTWVGRSGDGTRIVAGTSIDVTPDASDIAAGSMVVPLLPNTGEGLTGLSGWTIREPRPGGITRTVVIPGGQGEVEYAALASIDPMSFAEIPTAEPAWFAGFRDLARRFAELQAVVAAGGHVVPDVITDSDAYAAGFLPATLGEYL